MSDPYARGLVWGNPYTRRRVLRGRIVAVLDMRLDERGLALIPMPTRALVAGAIHELIVTAEPAELGGRVDQVAYLGFFEVTAGSVIKRGDQLIVGGETIADVAGFDETHAPNHLNIVLRSDRPATGEELGWRIESELTFVPRRVP